MTIALDSVSFLVSAVSVALIRKPEPRPEPKAAGQTGGMIAEIREGLAVITGSPILRSIAACTATSNLSTNIAFAAIIIFATRDLQLDAARIGVIFAIGNIGGLVGALIAGRAARYVGTGPAIVGSAAFGTAFLWLNAAATPATAFPILILTGLTSQIGNQVYNINQVSLRQSIVPDRLQGRMNASMRFIVWGTIPVGSFVGGILATVIGVRQGIFVGSIMATTAFLWILFSPVRRLKEPPPPWQPEPTEMPGAPVPAPAEASARESAPRREPESEEPFEPDPVGPVSEPPVGVAGPPPD